MSQEIKPCPFCGGTDIRTSHDQNIKCHGCEAEISLWEGDDMIAAWNRRSAPAATVGGNYLKEAEALCPYHSPGPSHNQIPCGELEKKRRLEFQHPFSPRAMLAIKWLIDFS